MTEQRDFRSLNITVSRETRKNSISRVWVDVYTFQIGSKIWGVNVLRQTKTIDKNAGETLAQAVEALGLAHGVNFVNAPKRVSSSSVNWSASSLYNDKFQTVA